MSTRDLQSILNSGEVTGINLNGVTTEDQVMTRGQIRSELQAAGAMAWKGSWVPNNVYLVNHVVTDEGWLAIANKTTETKPAPVPVGSPQSLFPVAPSFLEAAYTGVVYSGHKITFIKGGWVKQIKVQVPELTDTTNYRVLVVNNTDPLNPILTVIDDPILVENAWAVVAVGNSIISPGSEFLIIVDALNTGADQTVTGGWDYSGTGNALPLTQQWNSNNGESLLRIAKTDLDSTDRTSELMGITVGSTIQFAETASPTNFKLFNVEQNPTDEGTHIQFGLVSLADQGGTLTAGDTTTMTASIPIAQSTKYIEQTDYWITNGFPDFATIEGYVEKDGVPEAGHENDAYGVDIDFQEAVISGDWEILAVTDNLGGGGGGSSLSYDYSKVIGHVVAGDVYEPVGSLIVDAVSGVYEFKFSLTYQLNSTTTSMFLRWTTDGGATWSELQSESKDITDQRAIFYGYPLQHDGGVVDIQIEMRKEVAGDTLTVDYLDIILDQKG